MANESIYLLIFAIFKTSTVYGLILDWSDRFTYKAYPIIGRDYTKWYCVSQFLIPSINSGSVKIST